MTDTTIEGISRELTTLSGGEYMEGQDVTGSFKAPASLCHEPRCHPNPQRSLYVLRSAQLLLLLIHLTPPKLV